jgi:hemoglobin/transferrin/lactoferrin receptor protein
VEDEPYAISPTALDKEGYAVTDLHATWEPLEGIGLTVGASVTNLFDEYYYDQATYTVNAAGAKLGFPS